MRRIKHWRRDLTTLLQLKLSQNVLYNFAITKLNTYWVNNRIVNKSYCNFYLKFFNSKVLILAIFISICWFLHFIFGIALRVERVCYHFTDLILYNIKFQNANKCKLLEHFVAQVSSCVFDSLNNATCIRYFATTLALWCG